ncbi:MAG: hypothetical protein VYD54_02120 [Bdellovibrionota bacterium]|nr:hypothetical protein [Bdellovibrionota bacterium]
MNKNKILISLLSLLMITFSIETWSFFNSFGNEGSNGQAGYEGRIGEKGRDITYRADGRSQFFDLRGQDGGDGGHAEQGEDARWCTHHEPENDIEGASGGNGGQGGDGGDGGNGGIATLYYRTLSDLRNVVVDASPGYGGRAGRGSDGGYGCMCETYEWSKMLTETNYRTVTKKDCDAQNNCTEKRERVPYERSYEKTFYCEDGESGRAGKDGSHGLNGQYGRVKLIQKETPLEQVRPRANSTLEILRDPLFLSRHLWETRKGAHSILGSNSQVADTYNLWMGLLERGIKIEWAVPHKSFYTYKNTKVNLKLRDEIDFSFSGNFWPQYNVESRNGLKVIKIKNAMFRSEAEKIKPVDLTINGGKTKLVVKDQSNVHDELKTRFYLTAAWSRTDGNGSGLLKRFKGYIPSHLVRKNGGTYTISLGKLPIKSKYFKKRWLIGHYPVKFNLTIVRNFGNYSTKVGTFKIKKKAKKGMKVSKEKIEI